MIKYAILLAVVLALAAVFAWAFLWLRWSRLAILRHAGRIRPALPLRYCLLDPREHSVFLGRAHYRHGLRVSLEEHLLVVAPCTFKTAFLADVIVQRVAHEQLQRQQWRNLHRGRHDRPGRSRPRQQGPDRSPAGLPLRHLEGLHQPAEDNHL